jgi:hypothetical protein
MCFYFTYIMNKLHDMTIQKLSNDIIFKILSYLNVNQSSNFFTINKYYNSIRNNNKFWFMKLQQDYPSCIQITYLSYKDIYMTMKTKAVVYDWYKIINMGKYAVGDHIIVENNNIMDNRKEYHDESVQKEFIDDFNNILLQINPDSFQRDLNHELYLLTYLLNNYQSIANDYINSDLFILNNNAYYDSRTIGKLIIDRNTIRSEIGDRKVTIKCFYNDKYRLEYCTNYNHHMFICLYEIFDIDKCWIVTSKYQYQTFTSSDFIYFGKHTDRDFNKVVNINTSSNKSIDIDNVENGNTLFDFFKIISNIYICNIV